MTDFLQHMVALVAREPCLVPTADMFRLVEMAGFNRTHLAYHQIETSADPVLALGDGVLELIAMALEGEEAAAWQPAFRPALLPVKLIRRRRSVADKRTISASDVTVIDVPGVGALSVATHDDDDPYISGWIKLGNVFEPHILRVLSGLLKPRGRFLDVGGNLGWFAMVGSRLVGPTGRVYALEPDPDNYSLLKTNLTANGCVNARTWQRAAGSGNHRAKLALSKENRGDHRISDAPLANRKSINVRVSRVDTLLWPDRRIDMALVDTQGSEVNVLRGMSKTLDRNPHLRMIFEYWPHGLKGCGAHASDLAALMEVRGWRLWLLEDHQKPISITAQCLVTMADDVFAPETQRHADITAIPHDDFDGINFMESLMD